MTSYRIDFQRARQVVHQWIQLLFSSCQSGVTKCDDLRIFYGIERNIVHYVEQRNTNFLLFAFRKGEDRQKGRE